MHSRHRNKVLLVLKFTRIIYLDSVEFLFVEAVEVFDRFPNIIVVPVAIRRTLLV